LKRGLADIHDKTSQPSPKESEKYIGYWQVLSLVTRKDFKNLTCT
jgi:hypothetical protein